MTVEYRDADGSIRGAQARVIDFEHPAGNDWLAVNQFSVVENKHARRPDVVLFVNGLPLAVLELKNAAAENATIWSAFQQLQTYQAELPALFAPNALLAVSDGMEARVGTLGAGREWFKPWRTITGETLAERAHAGAAGGDQGPVRAAALSRPAARLHRVRGRRWPHRQEDGRLPPVPRGAGGGGGDAACGRLDRARDAAGWALRAGPQTRWSSGRPARGRGVAHAGLGQEPDDGRSTPAASSASRRWRTRRSSCSRTATTSTTSSSPPSRAAATCCASRRCRPKPRAPARAAQRGGGRGGVHHHPQVLPGGFTPIPAFPIEGEGAASWRGWRCCPTAATSW